MGMVADILVGVVAFVHVVISAVEMFLWRRPAIYSRLGFDQAQAEKAAPIVANAGLYNGFLAAGLVWALADPPDPLGVKTFFLGCVIIAGLFGAATLKSTTLIIQTLPAAVALALVWAAR